MGNGRVRVADTSVFPDEIRGHAMGTAMAVGIKAADIIAEDAPLHLKTNRPLSVTMEKTATMESGSAAANGDANDDLSSATVVSPSVLVVATVTIVCGWIAML